MTTYSNHPQQNKWEIWFIISVILFLGTVIVGTCTGSVQMFPRFDMWLGLVIANLTICVIVGCKN